LGYEKLILKHTSLVRIYKNDHSVILKYIIMYAYAFNIILKHIIMYVYTFNIKYIIF